MTKITKTLIASCTGITLLASTGAIVGVTLKQKTSKETNASKTQHDHEVLMKTYDNAYNEALKIRKNSLIDGAQPISLIFPILEKRINSGATVDEIKIAIFHISQFKTEADQYNESISKSNDAFKEKQEAVKTIVENDQKSEEARINLYSTYEAKWNTAHVIVEMKLIPNAKPPVNNFPKLDDKITTSSSVEEIEVAISHVQDFISLALKYNVNVSRANSAYLSNPGVFANGNFSKEFDPILSDSLLSEQYLNIFGDIKEVPKNAYQAALELKEMLRNSQEIKWHLTGDNIVDAFNAVRYVIAKWAQGSYEAKNKLKTFIDYTFPGSRVSTRQDSGFVAKAKSDINNWLNSNDVPIFLVNLSHLGEVEKNDGDSNYHNFPFLDKEHGGAEYLVNMGLQGQLPDMRKMSMISKAAWSKTEPLRISLPHMQQAQLRSQMIDWLGSFDGHNARATMQKISSNEAIEGAGIYANKPNISYDFKGWNIEENLLVPLRYKISNEETDYDAINNHGGLEFDFVEGLLTAVMTLYDYNDGSRTTGHRTACFDPSLDSVGWNIAFARPNTYLFFMTGNNAEFVDSPMKTEEETNLEFPWLKTLFPDGRATKVVSQFGMGALIRMIFWRFGQVDHDYTDWFYNGHLDVLNGLENAKINSLTELKDWLDQYYKLGGYGAQAFLRISSPRQLKIPTPFYNEVSMITQSTAVYNPLGSGTVFGEYASLHGSNYSKLPSEIY